MILRVLQCYELSIKCHHIILMVLIYHVYYEIIKWQKYMKIFLNDLIVYCAKRILNNQVVRHSTRTITTTAAASLSLTIMKVIIFSN